MNHTDDYCKYVFTVDQVARMVQTLLSLEAVPRPDHAAEALAIAICHANGAPHAAAVADGAVVDGRAEAEFEQLAGDARPEDIHIYRRPA